MREGGLVQCEIWSVYVCKCACVTKGTSLLMFTFLGSLVKSIFFNCHPQMFIRTLLSIYSDTTVWKAMRGALCLTSQQMSKRASEMLNWGMNGVWLEGMTHVCGWPKYQPTQVLGCSSNSWEARSHNTTKKLLKEASLSGWSLRLLLYSH